MTGVQTCALPISDKDSHHTSTNPIHLLGVPDRDELDARQRSTAVPASKSLSGHSVVWQAGIRATALVDAAASDSDAV